jgi:hypothetical protein
METQRIMFFDFREFCGDGDAYELCLMRFNEEETFNTTALRNRMKQLVEEYKTNYEDWVCSDLVEDVMNQICDEFPVSWEWSTAYCIEV